MPPQQKLIVFSLVAGVVLLVVLIASVQVRATKRRRELLSIWGNSRGFECSAKPEASLALDALSRTGVFRTLRTGEKGVKWVGRGEIAGRPATLLEHLYTTHAGKHTQTHSRVIVALDCPASWPTLTLTGEHAFHRFGEWLAGLGVVGEKLGLRDIKVESEEFNKRWRVKGQSEDFAILFLSPQVQEWGLALPKHTEVHIAGGVLCVSAALPASVATLPPLVGAMESLLSMLPEELEGYTPG